MFAAALFSFRVSLFCAYAILVYLLAILLAMNLFVFIVRPSHRRRKTSRKAGTKKNEKRNKQQTTSPPSPLILEASRPLPKGCRPTTKVIYTSNNESDYTASLRVLLLFTPGPGTFKFKYFRLCPDLLFCTAQCKENRNPGPDLCWFHARIARQRSDANRFYLS